MAAYFNNNIKKYRSELGYTQQQVADVIGGDDCQISRYESGEQLPPHEKLLKLASLFHVTIEDLLGTADCCNRRYTEDGTRILNIRKSQVVRHQFFSKVNETSVNIYPDGVRISTKCVRRWEDIDYIEFIVDEEQRLLIVRKSTMDDIDSQRWVSYRNEKRYGRKITGREFSYRLYSMMNWNRGYIHKVSGYVARNEDDVDEELWFFELDEAEGIPLTRSARERTGVKDTDIDDKTIEILDSIEKNRKNERMERQKLRAEGKNPGPVKQYCLYPDKWGQYTFGMPTEAHGIIPTVNLGKRE